MMRRTCLKFVERTNETAYVSVKNIVDGGCWAELGFLGRRQEINLGDGCLYTVNFTISIALVSETFSILENNNPRVYACSWI
jgi:Astacin (Peptidase family M12A)